MSQPPPHSPSRAFVEARERSAGGAAPGGNGPEAPLPRQALARAVRFRLIPFDKIVLDQSPAYLVRGVIPREGLVIVWGPPKCGKTFWAFDMVSHIALGWEYRGRRVTRGVVVYIACEGERGLAARAEAFRRKRLAEDGTVPDFYLLATRLDLVADCDELIADIRIQLGEIPPAIIVIDTLNRSIAGSESSDEDMGTYIKAADKIRETFRCAIVVIHHCGTDDKRPRGHTSLTGAADAQIAVKRDGAGLIVATVEWLKDGAEGDEFASRLEVVDLGEDTAGDGITSCVVEPADDLQVGRTSRRKKIRGSAGVALNLLRKAIEDVGEIPPASSHIPISVRAVKIEVWRKYCDAGAISESEKPDSRRKGFKRAADKLQEASAIGVWQEWAWIIL